MRMRNTTTKMKYIITESKLESAIISYLDENFYPDYGWNENTRHGSYQEDVDRYGDVVFFINDVAYSANFFIYSLTNFELHYENL